MSTYNTRSAFERLSGKPYMNDHILHNGPMHTHILLRPTSIPLHCTVQFHLTSPHSTPLHPTTANSVHHRIIISPFIYQHSCKAAPLTSARVVRVEVVGLLAAAVGDDGGMDGGKKTRNRGREGLMAPLIVNRTIA